MSGFLSDYKEMDDDEKVKKISDEIRYIERSTGNALSEGKFNLVLGVATGIQDYRASLRSFHWLNKCRAMKVTDIGTFLIYTDKNQARLALNYIREGVQEYFKTKNIFTVYEGSIIDGIGKVDRKTGRVDAIATTREGVKTF